MDLSGKHFGVMGLGGLGRMDVKFGKAFLVKLQHILKQREGGLGSF
jgi:D-arabinose 1-dehydrogenase-like Zn-dependent alcohol dehydrogenase